MSSDHPTAPDDANSPATAEPVATEPTGDVVPPVPNPARWIAAEWHGRAILDKNGEKIGKLEDVYVDVETDEPEFGTVKEGFFERHLTFVPLAGIQITPDALRIAVDRELVKSAPNLQLHGEELSQADESSLYHHFNQNYTPPASPSGRRLARR